MQHRIRKRRRQQIAILKRDAFRIDRVDALRLFQAHHISLAALDDGDIGAVCVKFLRHIVAAGARAKHESLAALPLRGILEVAGMHRRAGEGVETGQVGRIGNAAHAGCKYQVARMHAALAAIRPPQRDAPFAALVVIASGDKLGACPEVQLHRFDVEFEPVRELVLRNVDRERRWERQIGQVVDVHFVVQCQRVIARAPVVADTRMAVDDQRVDAELMQARGNRKPGLSAADHDHRRVMVGIRARLGKAIAPVRSAEVADAVAGLGRTVFQFLLVTPELFKRGDDCPRAQPRRHLRIGDKTDHAGTGAERGFELEQGLDGFGSGARHPARGRPMRGQMKILRVGARKRLAQR